MKKGNAQEGCPDIVDLCFCFFSSDVRATVRCWRGGVGGCRERRRERGGQQKDALGTVPILLVKLQHHVVGGHAQWAAALVVLLLVL